MPNYGASILGLLVLSAMSLILAGLVGPAKGKARVTAGSVPQADYANPLFRLERTHQNSLETLAVFAVPALCAMAVGLSPQALAVMIWAQVGLRLVFSWLYLRGIGLSAGGPRTFVFIASSTLTLVLMVWTAVAAMGWAG